MNLTPEQLAMRNRLLAGVSTVNAQAVDQSADARAAAIRAQRERESAFTLDAIDDLTRRGFAVFPITRGAKTPPLVTDWPAKATADADAARAMFEVLAPGANVGIHCTGLLVLDVDVGKGGDASLAMLESIRDVPETLTARTPSGGRHLFYRCPPGVQVPNTVSKIAPGIDTRGERGYVVGAGSRTEKGRYEWVSDQSIAPAPQWMLDALGRPAPAAERRDITAVPDAPESLYERALHWLRTAERSVKGAGGDQAAFRVACHLRDQGLSYAQACEAMRSEAWDYGCGWREGWLEQKPIRSAYRYAQNEPGVAVATAKDLPDPKDAAPLPADTFEPVTHQQPTAVGKARGPRALGDVAAPGTTPNGYAIKGMLQRGSYAVAYGPPGQGKTFVALDWAFHVAAGREWHGRRVHAGSTLYLAYEGAGGLRSRARALQNRYGTDFVPMYIDDTPYDLRAREGRQALGQAIAGLPSKPVLIVIDTLAHALCGGDENSAQDVSAFNAGVQALIAHTGACVLVIHHPGKSGTLRGSTALLGAVDTELRIENGRVAAEKQRDIELGPPAAFKLVPVPVGMDDDGDVVYSCVVEEVSGAPATPDGLPALKPGSLQATAYNTLLHMRPNNDPITSAEWRQACSDFLPARRNAWADVLLKLAKSRLIVKTADGLLQRRLE